jgi:formate/nitrite transporter
MNYLTPPEITSAVTAKGIEKANTPIFKLSILGFMGGFYVALGFLAYVRVAGGMPHEWGSFASLLGAVVFSIGLIGVLLAGGELITGNMLVVSMSYFRKKIYIQKLLYNWTVVTIMNFVGAIFVAYFLGHLTGLTEGTMAEYTIKVALAKTNASFVPAFFSGIGCNVFVCLAVWLSFGAKDYAGKIPAICFPVIIFVAVGFQHVVANAFIIPAAIFTGLSDITWGLFAQNCVYVWLGNMVGGVVFISLVYHLAYKEKQVS